jgi:hypothetical protein
MTAHRRILLGALVGGCITTQLDIRAQGARKVARIGWLGSSAMAPSPAWDAFVEGMRERGWVEGRDYTCCPRAATSGCPRSPPSWYSATSI